MRGRRLTVPSRADVRATVLLDLYGTLVEPDWPALLSGRAAIARRAGLAAATAHRAWDTTHAARMTGTYGPLADDLAAVFSEASDGTWSATSASLLSQLADEERTNWSRGVRLYPDTLPALDLLRSSGSQLAIVTNASAEAASVVDALGLRPLLDDVFASCEARVLKPDLLGLALHRLGANASDATLVDDDPVQLEAAARLGLGTILIQRSGAGASAAATYRGHRRVSDLRRVADQLARAEPAQRR
jgi:HAD superfamily hydrolase (TIGR01509 family)